MAVRIFLPGRGAVNLDAEQAGILNVAIPELGGLGQVTQDDIDASAVPKSYSDERDIRFYDATATYNTNEYVIHMNRVWFATADGVTGVEPSSTATQWAELTRENIFLNVDGDTGTIIADMAEDTLTISGGMGISTSASNDDDTLTVNLNAEIDDLTDVDTTTTTPEMNNVLQWDGTNWVPADISGTGFTILSDGATHVSATSAVTTIEVSGEGAVSAEVSSDTDSANLTISVADGTTSQAGLLPTADKTLLDDVRDGGYANADLSIDTSGTLLRLREAGANINTTELNNVLSLGNLSDVLSTISPRTDQILQWDGTQWDAVTLQPGDYEFPTAAGSDSVRLEPGDYFIQNRIRYRYTGITNSGITTRSVAAEAVIPQNILNSTEFERVGLQTAYHTFPITLETFLYRGDIVVHENIPYMFLGISTAGDGTISAADSLRVPPNTTISPDVLAANFLTLDTETNTTYELETSQATATDPVTVTLNASEGMDTAFDIAGTGSVTLTRSADGNVAVNGREPQAYTIPSGNPDETVTIYRGDVLIQDNVPYMWLGVGGPATALVAEDSKVIQTNSRITADFLAEHYLTLDSGDTTYTLATSQNAGENVVSIALDDGDTETTDSSINLIGGENISLERTDEGNIQITGVDVSTQHFPIYSSATLYELGDIIIYEFPTGSIQAEDATASPPIEAAPPVAAFLQMQFAGGSGPVPSGGRAAQEPIRSGQTGINAVSRDWKVPANSISVFHPWLQYSVNSIVDYEGALYRSLRDVLRTSDGNPLDPPSAAGTADWTLLDITDAAVINNSSVPELNGVSRQLWDRLNRVAIGYPLDSTMPTGVDNTADPVFVGAGANAQSVRALIDAAELTEPLRVWDSATTYAENDQVLHDGGSNVFSIYVAEQENTNVTPSLDNGANWHLVRGGIVSVRGPDDANPAGLSQNSTLSIQEGNGVNVARDGTTFTISQRASGHSDADNFGEGYAYSYFANFGFEERAQHEGIVGSRDVTAVITEVHRDDRGIRFVTETDISSATPSGGNNPYGFAVTDTPDRGDRTSLAPGATEDLIVYCTLDVPRNIYVSQVDPTIRNQADLETLFGVSEATPSRTGLSIGVNGFYTLMAHGHINPQYEPATWAREGNTDPIPETDNKLNNVSVWARASDTTTDIPDGHLGGVETWALQSSTDNVENTKLGALYAEPPGDDNINDGWLNPNIIRTTSDVSDLSDVNFTAPTDTSIQQVLSYDNTTDPANPVWVNADLDLPIGSRFRFSTTNATSNEVEITGFITDNDLETETFTTVRSANFNGVGGRLQFELARFMSQLTRTFSFAARPAWDQPWSDITSGNTARVTVQSEDDLFPAEHLETLVANTTNVTVDGNPRSRGTGNAWTLTYTDPTIVHPNSATLDGGSTDSIQVTATTNTGENDDSISSGVITWQSASFTNNARTFVSTRTFLQAYPNYVWVVRANGVNNTNSCVLSNFNFPNDGITTFAYTGNPATDITGHSQISIGNVGNVTFTTTNDIWNRDTALSADSLTATFVRPEGVTGSAYSVPLSRSQTGTPNFSYPLFYVLTSQGAAIPGSSTFASGTQVQAFTRIGTSQRDTRQLNFADLNIDVASATNVRTLWIAYPAALTAPISQTSTTTAPGNPPSTVTTSIPGTDRSTAQLTLVGASAPPTSAENYNWFRVNIPANVTYRLNSVSA